MIRRPPRSTLDRSSAASDVYKRQGEDLMRDDYTYLKNKKFDLSPLNRMFDELKITKPVSYTHLRAHETVLDIVCRLLLEKKKT